MGNANFKFLLEEVGKGRLEVAVHSAKSSASNVFVLLPPALPSGKEHGKENLDYLVDALQRGTLFIVCDKRIKKDMSAYQAQYPDVSFIYTDCTRHSLGALAAAQYKTNINCPAIIGITGTNGKTTESYLLEHIFKSAGHLVGVLGTVSYRWPGYEEDAPLTTPGCLEVHALLAKMKDAGVDFVFMEVSSHALDQGRVAGIEFAGALFTNLTQDHLDYHPDMEHYFQAKAKLFLSVKDGGLPADNKKIVCNMDDAAGVRLLKILPQATGYGLEKKSLPNKQVLGQVLEHNPDGLQMFIDFGDIAVSFSSHLVGLFNVHNILGAASIAKAFGLSGNTMKSLASFMGVPGRLEKVANKKGVSAFVDYAHTPDALQNVLETLKDVGFKRIITVFGCGGNRDKGKRPLMGAVVAKMSDIAIVTSDNPRKEVPEDIIADILPGFTSVEKVIVEVDRRKALEKAVSLLQVGDALLVAGKGHEAYQIIGETKFEFNDRLELERLLT